MEERFRIIRIEALPTEKDRLILSLISVGEETPDPTRIIKPQFRSEEEKIGYEMGMAIIKGMSEGAMAMPMISLPGSHKQQRDARFVGINLTLSIEEYKKIGSPPINSVIVLHVYITKEE